MTMIKNRGELARTGARKTAVDCLEAAIEAVHPDNIFAEHLTVEDDVLSVEGNEYHLDEYEEIAVIGGGNAAGHMAAALEALLGDRIDRGIVVTDDPIPTDHIDVFEGDYPIPSKRCMEGTRRVLDLAESMDETTLGLVVLSGGGSPLLSAPVADISLTDLQTVTNVLFENGVPLREINAVRKHLSAIKGGQLARAAAPAMLVGLVFSDVVGNDLGVVASGPLAPDETTFKDALDVLDSYDIAVPGRVRDRLRRGTLGHLSETPTRESDIFERVHHYVFADGAAALEGASDFTMNSGYDTLILSSRLRGDARESATFHVGIAEEVLATQNPVEPPAVLLSGGETPVTVRGQGAGRPNQKFALNAALELDDHRIAVASMSTDGHDGMTDTAGAVVDAMTVTDTVEARRALAKSESRCDEIHSYLSAQNDLIQTGTTGTNVNDIHVVVVEE